MIVIDSSLWIELFAGTELGKIIRYNPDYLNANFIVPSIIVTEVYKKLLLENDAYTALLFVTQMKVGKVIDLDVRIITATNASLKELVKEGKFREDLYYRINIFPINILPLRLRTDDIVKLTEHFLKIYNDKYNKQVTIEEKAISILEKYSWPGNIRELQNIMERIVIISETCDSIVVEKIESLLMIHMDTTISVPDKKGLKEIIENIERELIKKTLKEAGSTRKAAKILKISQSTVVKKLKKLGIDIVEY